MTDVSIIIVSYNTAELTLAAIRSVYDETRLSFELFVVDNNSSDGSADLIAERFPGVKLIRLDYNAGFAAANNLAAKEAGGRYVLLLNPDTVVLDGAVDTLVGFADEHPEYGVHGGSTFFADGSRNPTAGWNRPTAWSLFCAATGLMTLFRGSRVFDSESLSSWSWDRPRQVDIVTGCFMMLSRSLWNELGGFDERFHMYAEDADLSLRATGAGRSCILVPAAQVIHYGGASEPVRSDAMVRLFRAKLQLFRKHWPAGFAFYSETMLKLWALNRAIGLGIAARFSTSAGDGWKAWSAVFRRRTEWTR
jgi:N-acetylglucosaminyl-diphospho-decaprenol L-rhamnosyltransferase